MMCEMGAVMYYDTDDEIDSANAIIRYGDSCVVCDLPEGYDELDEGERYYLACRWLEDQRGDEW